MISLGSFRPTGKGEHLTENTDVETYISLRNYCNTVRKSRKVSQYCLEILYSWRAVPARGLKNCLNILIKCPIVTKTCQELYNFSNTKKLIFFLLEMLALILKIYLKIFNSRNYCYNRSRTLVYSSSTLRFRQKNWLSRILQCHAKLASHILIFLNFWSKSMELFIKPNQEL